MKFALFALLYTTQALRVVDKPMMAADDKPVDSPKMDNLLNQMKDLLVKLEDEKVKESAMTTEAPTTDAAMSNDNLMNLAQV